MSRKVRRAFLPALRAFLIARRVWQSLLRIQDLRIPRQSAQSLPLFLQFFVLFFCLTRFPK